MAVFMTDEQMLHHLLAVQETMISHGVKAYLPALGEVIAELRRRVEREETK